MSIKNWFQAKRIWAGLILFAFLFELRGLLNPQGGTLSAYTWSKTKTPAVRGLVVGLVGWLVYHFSYGANAPLGQWDVVSASIGICIGIASSLRRER